MPQIVVAFLLLHEHKVTDHEVVHASYAMKGWMVYSNYIQENQNNNNGIYKSRST